MTEQPNLSIIIPAFNEAKRIGQSLDQLSKFLDSKNYALVEVVAVVAKGKDQTLEIAKSKAGQFKHFNAIDAGVHVGKGRDVKSAMLKAHGKYRLFMDADLATPLHHIDTVISYIEQGKDVIIGVRDLKSSHSGLRKFISSFGNILIRLLLRIEIKDTQCGFKAFRDHVAEDLFGNQTITGWGFDMEILALAIKRGYSIQTIPITDWRDVAGGTFKNVAVSGAISTFKDLIKIKWNLMTGRYRKHLA